MIKKTLYLPEAVNDMWDELVRASGHNQSQLFEQLVREAYQRKMQDFTCEDIKNKMIFEQLDKIKKIDNDTNKKVFVLMEILNSMISTGISKSPGENYTPVDEDPHPWIQKSLNTLSQKITGFQHSSAARGEK
ncbi:MAG: hypothetical protein WC900_03165 [Oscillospiraceae bacterium]